LAVDVPGPNIPYPEQLGQHQPAAALDGCASPIAATAAITEKSNASRVM
jgi:hypothetical protein